jgi:hypothetical protein
MEHKRMYALSAALHQLTPCEQLLGFHAYRYKFFVDGSPRSSKCRYAVATIRMYCQDDEQQQLREYLQRVAPPLLELL